MVIGHYTEHMHVVTLHIRTSNIIVPKYFQFYMAQVIILLPPLLPAAQ